MKMNNKISVENRRRKGQYQFGLTFHAYDSGHKIKIMEQKKTTKFIS
jgi:hypothetical protein